MKKPLILTTIPAVLALCLLSACNKPGGSPSSPMGGGATPSNQSASSPTGSASTP